MKLTLALLSLSIVSSVTIAHANIHINKPTYPGTKLAFVVNEINVLRYPSEMNDICHALGYQSAVVPYANSLIPVQSRALRVILGFNDVLSMYEVGESTSFDHGYKQVASIDCTGKATNIKMQKLKVFEEAEVQRMLGSDLPVSFTSAGAADLFCEQAGYDMAGSVNTTSGLLRSDKPKNVNYMFPLYGKYVDNGTGIFYAHSVVCTKF